MSLLSLLMSETLDGDVSRTVYAMVVVVVRSRGVLIQRDAYV